MPTRRPAWSLTILIVWIAEVDQLRRKMTCPTDVFAEHRLNRPGQAPSTSCAGRRCLYNLRDQAKRRCFHAAHRRALPRCTGVGRR